MFSNSSNNAIWRVAAIFLIPGFILLAVLAQGLQKQSQYQQNIQRLDREIHQLKMDKLAVQQRVDQMSWWKH